MTAIFDKGTNLRVATPIAAMHSEPRINSAWTSQLVAGNVVELLEQRNDWLWVRGEDAYRGWMHRGYLQVASGSELNWPVSLGCRVQAGAREFPLPLLARVNPDWFVVDGEIAILSDRASRFPRDPGSIAASAVSFFDGASYVWGGVVPWGCDCSGLVQTVFALHGIQLPRDAHMQAESGQQVTADFAKLQPADLVFFSDRDDKRATHVGIMLGHSRMAHSALGRGGFEVEDFGAVGDKYAEKLKQRFTVARRVVAVGLSS